MFRYYFTLGLRSLRRNPALTALMVLTLAIGVAASMSTLTILHVMSGNPIPAKSARLIVPLLDVAPAKNYVPGFREEWAVQNTYRDSLNMLQSGQGARRTVLYDVSGSIEPARREEPLVDVQGISTTADFFPMFEVPFRYGAAWSAADDARAARVVVFTRKKAEAVFGAGDPVGRKVRLFNNEFTVAGVLDDWNPVPRYPHLVNGTGGYFQGEDEIYVPFRTTIDLEMRSNGNTSCSHSSGAGFKGLVESECTWIQVWIELASAADRPALQSWLDAYAAEQQRQGRLERKAPNQLFDVMEWMAFLNVVRADNKLAVWLSLGFLLLCIVNTMGLLLAKFSTRASEVGVRRALGAARGAIFRQFLVETGVVGLAGGVLGLVLAFASLWLIRQQSRDLSALAQMDWKMLAVTFVIAVAASLVAGLLPTWRACQVAPAVQLKSQ